MFDAWRRQQASEQSDKAKAEYVNEINKRAAEKKLITMRDIDKRVEHVSESDYNK